MYKEHSCFIQPTNEDIKVWRYLDLTKFLAMLESRSLYFCRADKFEDQFEGSWPKINVEARQALAGVPENEQDLYKKVLPVIQTLYIFMPRFVAVNCWHMNNFESAAMWKLYSKDNEGLAIQSTYSRLKKSFIDHNEVHLGVVNYIDYDSEYINGNNAFHPYMHKRKSFEHEKEVRATVIKFPVTDGKLDILKETIDYGLNVEIDLESLIESIYVAPFASDWYVDLVNKITNLLGYKFKITHSKLGENPVY